jgi:hypothetical protein
MERMSTMVLKLEHHQQQKTLTWHAKCRSALRHFHKHCLEQPDVVLSLVRA